MGEVIHLVQSEDTPVSGREATAKVVAWLREQADLIENADSNRDAPYGDTEKAVLILYASATEASQFWIGSRYVNTNGVIERVGIVKLALADICNN